MGWDGMGWKSLKLLILRAPLCGANNLTVGYNNFQSGEKEQNHVLIASHDIVLRCQGPESGWPIDF